MDSYGDGWMCDKDLVSSEATICYNSAIPAKDGAWRDAMIRARFDQHCQEAAPMYSWAWSNTPDLMETKEKC